MSAPDRQQRLAALRDTIADIERRPILAQPRALPQQAEAGGFPVLAGGLVQEVFTAERRNSAAALGFALAQARSLLQGQRSAVIYLQIASEAQEMGLPYGPGLASFGFDPDALVLIRPANIVELLWAAEEALACSAVAAVIADIAGQPKALDFTASRRFNLRAAEAGASLYLLRYGAWREASAAQLRWQIVPMLSAETPYDARAPGNARWQARLEKGVIADQQNQQWLMGWTKNGFKIIDAGSVDADAQRHAAAATPLSDAVFADLADRLSQTA